MCTFFVLPTIVLGLCMYGHVNSKPKIQIPRCLNEQTTRDQDRACLIKLNNAGDTYHCSNALPMDNQSDWDALALDVSLLQVSISE